MAYNDRPDCAVMCNLINTYTSIIDPPLEDQCEWHRMTRMTGPNCAVMCNLINTHTHTHPCRVWSDVIIVSVKDSLLERTNTSIISIK